MEQLAYFGEEAKIHDFEVSKVSKMALKSLVAEFPLLTFRYREEVAKKEINEALRKVDAELGQTLFVPEARIKPDGGLIEVKDDNGAWRIVLVSEAKHQCKDIENIKAGVLVGKNQIYNEPHCFAESAQVPVSPAFQSARELLLKKLSFFSPSEWRREAARR